MHLIVIVALSDIYVCYTCVLGYTYVYCTNTCAADGGGMLAGASFVEGADSTMGLESFELSEAISPRSLQHYRGNGERDEEDDDDDQTTKPHMPHLNMPRFQFFAQRVVDEVFTCVQCTVAAIAPFFYACLRLQTFKRSRHVYYLRVRLC